MEKYPSIYEIINELPITKKVIQYSKNSKLRFHTPGHKGRGIGLNEILNVSNDVTEVSDLDNLLSPTSCIKESQNKLAKILGAKKTFFVTTGATTAILSAIYSVKNMGRIAILRSSHTSIYSACEIANVEPYLIDDIDEFGELISVDINLLKISIISKEVKTIVLTRPTYEGNCFDITKISQLIKENNKILIVDEAHGSHLYYSDLFPKSANSFADIYVNSLHKTLPALTSCATLSVNNINLISNVEKSLHLFHTTSPNYLMLMSMEYAIYCYSHNEVGLTKWLKRVNILRNNLEESGVLLCDNEDKTRLVIDCERMKINGLELSEKLEGKDIFCEYSTYSKIVFILTYFDDEIDYVNLTNELIRAKRQCREFLVEKIIFPKKLRMVVPYLKAVNSEAVEINFEQAIGKIVANNFGVYPPARPIAVAGERITKDMINYLDLPYNFYGISNGKIMVIK